MTRYGFAIKALPKGGKPFGEEDDENEQAAGQAPAGDTTLGAPAEELPPDSAAAPAAPAEDATAPSESPPEAAAEELAPDAAEGEEGLGTAPAPPDGSRPWAGDEYNEGNETAPDGPDAWSAYAGSGGEQAWLDKAPDGTLTGWVQNAAGQTWRYTDPDAWATDVDGAQMTQTHNNGEDRAGAAGDAAPATPPRTDRGIQDSMFASQ